MIEIIILAMFAGFIILRLISVLGRRPEGEESQTHDHFQAHRPNNRARLDDFKPAAPGKGGDRRPAPFHGDPKVRAALEKIYEADPHFDLPAFMDGAKSAYEMILTAFWRGERATYEPFVSDEIGELFDSAIKAREAAGQKLDNRLESLLSAELKDAHLNGAMAELTLAFKSRIISVTHDAEGRVVEGDENQAVEGTDLWTFSRNVTSQDPNWLLIETTSAD